MSGLCEGYMKVAIRIESLAELWKISIAKTMEFLTEMELSIDTIKYVDIYRITFLLDVRNPIITYKKAPCRCCARIPRPPRPRRCATSIRNAVDKLYVELYDYVRERDGNMCVLCKAVGCGNKITEKLHMHHVNGVHSDMYPENMVLLCNRCHRTFHKFP
jgi:hypothetical protein